MSGVLSGRVRGSAGLVVVGAGVAGLRTVQGVRREGYDGPITLIGAEAHLPYDRPPLSKQVLTGELGSAPVAYHDREYFQDLGVTVLTGTRVDSVDVQARTLAVQFEGSDVREHIPFAALVVATGARPRRLPCTVPPQGVHVVRTCDDAAALYEELLATPTVIVIGGGFIGAEVASSARTLGLDVTVLEAGRFPMRRALGPVIAELLSGLHELNGVTLRCGSSVSGFLGVDRVEGVLLDDGTAIEAGLVVVGIGVVPDVDWLTGSGLSLGDGLICDEFLRAGSETVLGVGDAASCPNMAIGGRRVRSQQWTTAGDQGTHAARVLTHGTEIAGPFSHDMYFWSDQYGVKIQGSGDLSGDVEVVEARPDLSRLVTAYRNGDLVRGAVTVNAPKQFRRLRKMIGTEDPWRGVVEFTSAPAGYSGGEVR
ncbi:NAD(P)/FAD-dependent oxidoreductase [Rhodococcus jostii]|uniref:Reductase C-terminal n=1 Tax=Rhodococcus jostii TaxID=132919 RepID=A0A1H5LV88_RHOJO|nr:FAD-dependent oxidoreductase [Rhodococcus sp. ACS1]SEE80939.1 Reductase C-terminal [Rhodococcus jostii]